MDGKDKRKGKKVEDKDGGEGKKARKGVSKDFGKVPLREPPCQCSCCLPVLNGFSHS